MSAASTCRPAPRLLVLWDIDHTLIETRGVGRAIYERAFPSATGTPLTTLATISGRTELNIMTESLRLNDIEPTNEMVTQLARALVRGYQDGRDTLRTTGRALPGVEDTLASLARSPIVYQSVLTGNLRDVARIKLEAFDLDHYLDLDAGAYGDDDPERPELVAIGQQRATERTGVMFGNNTSDDRRHATRRRSRASRRRAGDRGSNRKDKHPGTARRRRATRRSQPG